jgi:hypothetical protein
MEPAAPDVLEPVTGWRVFDVVPLDGELRLCSLAFWTVWIPGRPARAVCRRLLIDRGWAGLPEHDAPDERCTCGIYATRTARAAAAYARAAGVRSDTVHRVAGRVSLWGTVIECEGGWRAAQAYPAALFVPTGRGRLRLRRRLPAARRPVAQVARGLRGYGVPVEIVDAATWQELGRRLEARPGL